jgi:hypothetical protein
MADYGLKERTLGEVGTSLAAEGAGVTAGFLAAGIVGRQIQNRIKSDAEVVTTTDKIMAWSANNIPKMAMWYLLKKYAPVEPGEVLTPVKEATIDAKKAVAGSIIFDTLVRLSHDGKNTGDLKLWGYQIMSGEPQKSVQSSSADTQRLIQENSALRAELNKALQRLATPAVSPAMQYTPVAPTIQAQPGQHERQTKYGFMKKGEEELQSPPSRQAKYGFMKGGENDIASMFGML